MKTYDIKNLLKKELLIIEIPENIKSWEFIDGHFWIDDKKVFIKGFSAFHTLLGSPDEIKEEDVEDLVESWEPLDSKVWVYNNYSEGGVEFKTAIESFNSALESEIFWNVNPIKIIPRGEASEHERVDNQNKFKEAQEKTIS